MQNNEKKLNNHYQHHHYHKKIRIISNFWTQVMTSNLACSNKGITNYTKKATSAKHGINKKRDSERNQTNSV